MGKTTTERTANGKVTLHESTPAGFGCPCHGGQYDTEGNRTAGTPVRALDRYTYSIVNGHLVLGSAYSVAKVEGTGKDAQIKKTRLHNPGQHVDGPEFWL
jgi:Rieske Fe-S protein